MADLERQVRDAQLALETRNYVPKRFVCGLSKQVMRRPVRAEDGNVYDKKALEEYVRLSEASGELLSPVTQKPMDPGYHHEAELEEEIRQFLEENFPMKESAWKQMKTPREAPLQWPALMSTTHITPRTFSKQAAMTEAAFHGSVSSKEGPEVKTVVSFPGQYQEDWQCLVRRSVKRTTFEAEDPDQPCAHYLSGSTACVFLPEGSKLYGGHMPNEDGTPSSCWRQDLYDKKQSFGCRWFEKWRLRVQTAVERKHTLVVVYKAAQKGVGREGLTWPPRIECSTARRGDAGLGVSQRGEVAWLLRHGICFEEEDIHEYRRRLASDIKLELKELQSRSPLPSLRDMQPQFVADLEMELDDLERVGDIGIGYGEWWQEFCKKKFESWQLTGRAPLPVVRLCFVGQGRAGKTTTLRRLRGEEPKQGSEDSTYGVEVWAGEAQATFVAKVPEEHMENLQASEDRKPWWERLPSEPPSEGQPKDPQPGQPHAADQTKERKLRVPPAVPHSANQPEDAETMFGPRRMDEDLLVEISKLTDETQPIQPRLQCWDFAGQGDYAQSNLLRFLRCQPATGRGLAGAAVLALVCRPIRQRRGQRD